MLKKRNTVYLLGVLLLLLLFFAFRTSLKVVEVTIESEKVTHGLKIALITDLHNTPYGENQKELLEELELANPDVILIGGDIIDDMEKLDHAKEFLAGISKTYTTGYVSGNHEFWTGEADAIKEMIGSYGVFVLEGNAMELDLKEENITIVGIDDPEVGEEAFAQQLEASATAIPKDNFSVLLTHRPERIETYLEYDFDLILAGHAHGGQWRIPYVINGVFAPNQGIFPKYAGGLYAFDKTHLDKTHLDKTHQVKSFMVVSRGLARNNMKIPRIFNRPELVILHITSQEE